MRFYKNIILFFILILITEVAFGLDLYSKYKKQSPDKNTVTKEAPAVVEQKKDAFGSFEPNIQTVNDISKKFKDSFSNLGASGFKEFRKLYWSSEYDIKDEKETHNINVMNEIEKELIVLEKINGKIKEVVEDQETKEGARDLITVKVYRIIWQSGLITAIQVKMFNSLDQYERQEVISISKIY